MTQGLGFLIFVTSKWSEPGKRVPPSRLVLAAILLAVLAVLNLLVAGQSWGVVYGLGLWGAKIFQLGGMDVATSGFWSAASHSERLHQSVLTDVTSLTNIGLILGAFVIMRWRANGKAQVSSLRLSSWFVIAIAGLMLGYSSRVAFGCNVGANFSGISTGSTLWCNLSL